MVPHKVLTDIKLQHPEVYVFSQGTKDYIFRPLALGEFAKLSTGAMSSAEAEDFAVQSAVIWPEGFDVGNMRAGAVTALAQEILEVSAFTNPKLARKIFADKRDHADDVVNVMKALILACHAELGIDNQELEGYTFAQLAEKTALAEKVVQIKKTIYDPGLELELEIIDPEEIAEADRKLQEEELRKAQNPHNIDSGSKAGTARGDDPIAARLHQALSGF